MNKEQNLSKAEYICQDFNRYLDDLKSQGKCYFLPFTIKKIRLRNIRVFKEFEVQFEDFNLVVGDCLTGKTTLVKSIAFTTGLLHLSEDTLLRAERKKGTIDLVIDISGMLDTLHVTITKDSIRDLENNGCILLDDSGLLLPLHHYLDFLVFLSGLHKQLITTVSKSLLSKNHYELIRKNIPECNIISTERGDLKKSC